MTEEEEQTRRAHNRILVAESPAPPTDLRERLAELRRLADAGDAQALLRVMRELVPTFQTPEPDPTMQPMAGEALGGQPVPFDQDGTTPRTFPVPPGQA